jgi:HK97 family phage major capsid protein
MTITTNHPLATENNVESLNRLALDTIGKAEALLAEGNIEGAKGVYADLDAIEKRRDELGEIDTMRARMAREKAKSATPATPMRHPEERPMGGERKLILPGEAFINSPEYKAMLNQRAFDNPQARMPEFGIPLDYSLLQLKTLVIGNSVSGAGAFVLNDYQPGYVDLRQRQRTLLDLIHRVRTSSDTIDWVKEITFTNNAATVAEATATTGTSGTKAESSLNYQRVTQAVETIAHWIPITTRALSDSPQMQDIINGRLLTGLELTLESQVLTGDGNSPNLLGILNSTILTQATASTENAMDSLLKAAVKIQVSGLVMPTDIVLYPTNWQTLRLLRENSATATLGQYLMGPPSLPGPMTIFGLPVTLSLGMTSGTGLVGAFTAETHALFDREQAIVRMGYIDQMFVRNMLAMLAELRAAMAVFRPNGFCSITGLT